MVPCTFCARGCFPVYALGGGVTTSESRWNPVKKLIAEILAEHKPRVFRDYAAKNQYERSKSLCTESTDAIV